MEFLDLPIPVEKRAELQIQALRPLVSGEPKKFRPELIVMLGENTSDDQRRWASPLMSRPDYSGPVRCTPWDGFRSLILTGETAIHTVDLLMHEVYGVIFIEEPELMRDESNPVITRGLIKGHLLQYSHDIVARATEVARSLHSSQWLNLFALATVELAKLSNPSPAIPTGRSAKLVTVEDVAAMLVDVEAKTLHNSDVKKWGAPEGRVNRSRAWNLDRIRPIIEQTRQFKDV